MPIKLSNIKVTLGNYTFIMKLALHSAKKYFLALSALSLLQIGIPPIILILTKKILDTLVSIEGKSSDLIIIIGLLIFFNLISSLVFEIKRMLNVLMSQLIENHLTGIILEKAVGLELKYFDTPEYYEKQKSVYRTLNGNWEMLVLGAVNTVNLGATLVIMILILLSLNVWLCVITIAGVVPAIIVGIYSKSSQFKFYTHTIPEMRKIDYIKRVLTDPHFSKEVRLFQFGDHYLQIYNSLFSNLFISNKKLQLSIFFKEFGAKIISICSSGGCQLFIALKAFNKIITIGDYSMYFGAIQNISESLTHALNIIAMSYENFLLSDALAAYINLKPDIVLGKGVEIKNNGDIPVIEFRNVSFKYPGARNNVLNNLNFKIEPSEKVAFVGFNGAGKTTIVKLMTRLYDVTDGVVLLNGKDIKIYKPEDVYRIYSTVFQDYVKYAFSIRENIAIGNLKGLKDQNEIESALKKTGLTNVVDKLPNSYETYITKMYDMSGIPDLSVGEWQKMAIARAFFRQASIYILDEPTASLDPKAEHEVFEQFVNICEGKTAVLISHRLSSVRMVDRIFYLEGGTIVESGYHNELIELNGEYAKLFNLQASKYIG